MYLFAWPFKVDYGWQFVNDAKFKKYIYSNETKYICTQGIILHPATVYLCSFKEFYLFNFKEMIYFLTVKIILILSNNIYLFTKSIIIRGNYILTRNYIHFKEPYQFVSRKYILVQRNIFIQGNCIHSRKYIYLRNIYSFKFKAICSFKETIFIEHCCIRGIADWNIYSKIVPSHFMIIISFTITISWIKYSYDFFRLKDEEVVNMIEVSVL